MPKKGKGSRVEFWPFLGAGTQVLQEAREAEEGTWELPASLCPSWHARPLPCNAKKRRKSRSNFGRRLPTFRAWTSPRAQTPEGTPGPGILPLPGPGGKREACFPLLRRAPDR